MNHIKGHMVEGPQGRFVVQSDDNEIGRLLRDTGEWCWDDLQPLLARIKSTDTILVVGAHIGTTVVPASRIARTVIAVEANPEVARLLRANLVLNDCHNVKVIIGAASDQQGVARFRVNRRNSGSSHREPDELSPDYRDNPKFHDSQQTIIETPTLPLGAAIMGPVHGIFMDIEGSEYAALRGMEIHLRSARFLVTEFFATHLRDMARVTPEAFAAVVAPHFDHVWSPKYRIGGTRSEFPAVLRRLYDNGFEEDGLLFWKHEMEIIEPLAIL